VYLLYIVITFTNVILEERKTKKQYKQYKIKIMKKTVYLLVFMIMSNLLFGQSVTLTYLGNPLNANDTIFIPVDRVDYNLEYIAAFIMHNVTNETVQLRAAKNAISLVAGAEASICMSGICADPIVDTTPPELVYLLEPNTTAPADVFTLHYYPRGQYGNSLLKVTLFNADDPSDNVIFFVIFGTEVEISDAKVTNTGITAYPNPATDRVTIKYSLNKNVTAKLVLKNLMGHTLYTVPLNANCDKVNVDISQYASGIYFYSLMIDEQIISTKKLLVR